MSFASQKTEPWPCTHGAQPCLAHGALGPLLLDVRVSYSRKYQSLHTKDSLQESVGLIAGVWSSKVLPKISQSALLELAPGSENALSSLP